MRYSKYPIYRDSGVEWLGDLPKYWLTPKLKLFITTTKGFAFKSDSFIEEGVPVVKMSEIKNGTINQSTAFLPTEFQSTHNQVMLRYQDIIVSTVGSAPEVKNSAVGQIGIVPKSHDGSLLNQNTVVYSPNRKLLSNDYLPYVLKSQAYREHLDLHAHGTANQASLNLTDMLKFVFPFPPLEEQQTIANYLDITTAKIDTLIEKQTKLIELLKEKRQSVILKAVTRGLDDTVAMKDSGVEWLGEIPEHWEVKKLKYLIKGIESGTSVNAANNPATATDYGVLKTSCVYNENFRVKENKTVIESERNRVTCPLRVNTLIVSRMNTPELVGAAGLVTEAPSNIYLPDRLWQVSFTNTSPKFVHYLTLTNVYRGYIHTVCAGTSSSMQNLSQDDFKDFSTSVPSLLEQETINEYIDYKTNKIDNLITKATKAITLLKEKRTALISSAVTGKIDVREAI